MIKVVIEGKQYRLVEQNDLGKLLNLIKKKYKVEDDLFEKFLKEMK